MPPVRSRCSWNRESSGFFALPIVRVQSGVISGSVREHPAASNVSERSHFSRFVERAVSDGLQCPIAKSFPPCRSSPRTRKMGMTANFATISLWTMLRSKSDVDGM